MINLYKLNETNFKHNEFVLSEATLCDVTEYLNGTFELDLEYPLKDSKGISKYLVTGATIKVPMDDGREPQLFCLRRPKTSLTKIEGYAQHIAITKLSKNMIKDTNIVNKTRRQAIQHVLSNTMYTHNFIVGNKDNNTTINNLRIVRYSPLNAIMGSDNNTIINRYGGELILDNFTLDIVDTRGEDTGLIISYKKNLTGVELTTDDLDLATEIIPIGNDDLLLPEYSIKSPLFYNYSDPCVKEVKVDIGVVEPDYDSEGKVTNASEVFTADQCYKYMREYVSNMFICEKVDQLNFNLTVNFVQLQDTEEYKNYSGLAKINQVGDIVTVRHAILGLDLKGRVQKIKKNILNKRIKEIEIGFSKKSIADIIKDTNKKVDDTKKELKEDISKANETTNNLKVTMEKRESEIELSVKNEAKARETEIKLMDDKIEEKVSEDTFNSYKTQTTREISQKISAGKEFSSELKQNVDIFQFLFNEASGNKTEITKDGITVYSGGFKIKDKRGNTVLSIDNDGTINCGYMGVKDINIHAKGKGSMFYNAVANMEELYCDKFSCERLYVDGQHIANYIRKQIDDYKG